ncbi:ABC transporter permease [Microbacterium testaceum]|uniref:Nitrate transport permease nrtB n=1 Tax=Microbacterium testaceum TaxID=2033 RepID=A0A147FCJ5_MICTE|nr:ABC transporter permease [Microbacterium testaceum]KTS14317.1 nitrate transport permease nrtB [Microbacterium testaceum]
MTLPSTRADATTSATTPATTRRPRRRRYRIGQTMTRRRYVTTAVVSFVVLLVLWALVSAAGVANPRFLPSPLDVAVTLGEQIANGQLLADLGASTYRILVGFLLATVLAVPIGAVVGISARVEAAVQPLVDFIRYMPVVAFVPLTILWIGVGEEQKWLIIFLGTFFQQVLMVADAVRSVPRSFIDVGETLGLSNGRILARIVLRASAPRIWDALRITLGWAWTWIVLAELVAATTGLGYRIVLAQRFLQTDLIFAYLIVLGILGLVTDVLMRLIGRALFRYERIRR